MKREGRPQVQMHPDDMGAQWPGRGAEVILGNELGEVRLHVAANASLQRGVLISEGIFPNHAFEDGCGINTLVGADQPAPVGGGCFHDIHVWVKAA
jgi:hypothetical protein